MVVLVRDGSFIAFRDDDPFSGCISYVSSVRPVCTTTTPELSIGRIFFILDFLVSSTVDVDFDSLIIN
jgi:hypothetical protein